MSNTANTAQENNSTFNEVMRGIDLGVDVDIFGRDSNGKEWTFDALKAVNDKKDAIKATKVIARIENLLAVQELKLQSPGDAFPSTFKTGEGGKVLDYLVLFSDLENVAENLDSEIASFLCD